MTETSFRRPSMWTSPVICSTLAELFSRFSFTLPLTSSTETSPCWLAISTSPSRPVTETSPLRAVMWSSILRGIEISRSLCTEWSPAAWVLASRTITLPARVICGLRLLIVLIGVALVFRAHAFADYDCDFVVVGDADAHRAVLVIDAQAGDGGRYVLFEVIIEVVGLAEDVIKIAVVDVHVVADFAPVEARGLGGDESADHDDDDQKNSTRANAASGQCRRVELADARSA